MRSIRIAALCLLFVSWKLDQLHSGHGSCFLHWCSLAHQLRFIIKRFVHQAHESIAGKVYHGCCKSDSRQRPSHLPSRLAAATKYCTWSPVSQQLLLEQCLWIFGHCTPVSCMCMTAIALLTGMILIAGTHVQALFLHWS